jgi:hypothetical protein
MKTKILFTLLACVFIFSTANSQTKKEKKIAGYTVDNYEVECLGTGSEGTQLMKIWGYGKKPEDAVIHAKLNAVHAVIFKGIFVGEPGCMKKPLVTDPGVEEKNQDYFDAFFKPNGEYLSYVAVSGEGVRESIKVDKKTYKVAIFVSVQHASLRKKLENDGIIKKLGAGF